ncbi:hypothetical protein ACNO6Z_10505 [Aliarcobacter lanthieri]|uniref:hypothetical protein n=1 Tax=Aliarcobacter lanthieri TaxID=1355374 RepID=UPI003AA96062
MSAKEQLLKDAKPIIFNTEMVKAILEGRKTQTRRVIKLKNNDLIFTGFIMSSTAKGREGCCSFGLNREQDLEYVKQQYKVGDVLWVRETFQTCGCDICEVCNALDGIVYKADYNSKGEHPDLYTCLEDEMYWKPPIRMPKKYARIFLKVTNIRVERLQDISILDAIKEGCPKEYFDGKTGTKEQVKDWWINLWNSTAKDGYRWENNPYVFVYEFEKIGV